MVISIIRRQRGSLFFKLLIIYGLTFFFIFLALSLPRVMRSDWRKGHIVNHIEKYVGYLSQEIGSPPDIEKARVIAQDLKLAIAIEGTELNFRTENFRDRRRSGPRHNNMQVTHGDYRFSFQLAKPQPNPLVDLLIPLGLILVIMMISYHMIRRIFRPLREIEEAAKKITRGQFSIEIANKGGGELFSLAQSIENMADRLGDRFDNLRNLLHGISHELRTPLTRMKLALEFLDNQKVRDSISHDIEQIDEITGTLLESERLRNNPGVLLKEKLRIDEIVEDTVKALFVEPSKVDMKLSDIALVVDPSRLKLLIRNVLNNSKKYAPESRIDIEFKKLDSEYCRLSFRDYGPGFSTKVLDRFGQPFLRNEESHVKTSGGFGLGLSLCLSIVEAHGGKMKIGNHSSGGAMVEIDLPFEDSSPNT